MNYLISKISNFERCNAGIPSSLIYAATADVIEEQWGDGKALGKALRNGEFDYEKAAKAVNLEFEEAECSIRVDVNDMRDALEGMEKRHMTTEEIYTEIMMSEVFRLNGAEIDLTERLLALTDAIKEDEETNWFLGECSEACLADLVIGAFWSLTENSGGQTSDTYRALSALGDIYFPKMSSAPKENESSFTAYELINAYYAKK
jgi:hypothetical protein